MYYSIYLQIYINNRCDEINIFNVYMFVFTTGIRASLEKTACGFFCLFFCTQLLEGS